jgi:hypothetical protein
MAVYRDPETGQFISREEYLERIAETEGFDYEDFGTELDGNFDFAEEEVY